MANRLCFLFLLFICSCNEPPDPTSIGREELTQIREQIEAIQQTETDLPPSIVAISYDQSGSMAKYPLAPINFSDLRGIFDVMRETGGSLVVSPICSDSNVPLVRASFPLPPRLAISAEDLNPPEPPDLTGNPFHSTHLHEFARIYSLFRQTILEIPEDISLFQQATMQHDQNHELILQRVESGVQQILGHPHICQTTDIRNSITRINVAVQEDLGYPETPRTLAIFITDGLDSYSGEPAQLDVDQVVLVNGSSEVGIFSGISHLHFENPHIALDRVVTWLNHP